MKETDEKAGKYTTENATSYPWTKPTEKPTEKQKDTEKEAPKKKAWPEHKERRSVKRQDD